MAWLELLVSDKPDLTPRPRAVVQAFGRNSMTFGRARLVLESIWEAVGHDPEVQLKRDLWHRLLAEAYGDEGDALGRGTAPRAINPRDLAPCPRS